MANYKSLIGRQWQYGVFDCYSIVRDYYALLGIKLPDYERPESFETCESIFLKNANKLNFYKKCVDVILKIQKIKPVKKIKFGSNKYFNLNKIL